jgi:hypothetical protein
MRIGGPTGFLFQFDRLAPSESGTVFIDGVSQGGAGTDANGRGMITLTRPAAIGPHSVIFAGVTGDLAIAPLYVICAASYNFTLTTGTFIPATTDAAAIDGRERQLDPQIAERGPGVSTGDRPAQVSAF